MVLAGNKERVCMLIICLNVFPGMIVTSALIIWKGLMCVTGSESPVVVVLSGSMEPGFKRVSYLITLDVNHGTQTNLICKSFLVG